MTIDKSNLPKHIAIIMDGNGRWAKQRGLPRTEGHRKGINTVEKIIEAARELNIKVISFFAFSTENWNRPKKEIDMLMGSLERFLTKKLPKFHKNDIRLVVSGDLSRLPAVLQKKLNDAIEKTSKNKSLTVNLCLNYGGRADIVNAARDIVKEALGGRLKPDDLTEESFSSYLYTKGLPDPDLLIRTSGEMRISNFFLWQFSYTEFFFPEKFWPDFDKSDLVQAIEEFQKRNRRFGRLE